VQPSTWAPVPAAFRPHLPLCVGHPGGQAGSGYLGQEHRTQQLGIRLARIRVVAHAAGKFLAGEHHGAARTPMPWAMARSSSAASAAACGCAWCIRRSGRAPDGTQQDRDNQEHLPAVVRPGPDRHPRRDDTTARLSSSLITSPAWIAAPSTATSERAGGHQDPPAKQPVKSRVAGHSTHRADRAMPRNCETGELTVTDREDEENHSRRMGWTSLVSTY
jgi:hypothetical protein